MTIDLRWVALAFATALLGSADVRGQNVTGTVAAPGLRMRGAIVYLEPAGPVGALPLEEPNIDQFGLRFDPDVLVIPPATRVEFPNSDPVLHNVFSPGPGESFNLGTYPPSETRFHTFATPGVHVILCNVHPEMVAYVLVARSVAHAVVDRQSRFAIEDVPPGDYILRVWHRRSAPFSQAVSISARGTLNLNLQLERLER